MDDERGDDEYDYEYEDDDIDDDDMAAGMDSGGGASAAPARSAGGASSAAAEADLALRDESVAFVDQPQLKVIMSKVIADIRCVVFDEMGLWRIVEVCRTYCIETKEQVFLPCLFFFLFRETPSSVYYVLSTIINNINSINTNNSIHLIVSTQC